MRKILWASLFAWIVLTLASCNPGPPKVIQTVAPIYPGITRIMRIEGSIVISVGIDPNGRVSRATVVSGPKVLQETSVAAAKKWIFETGSRTRTASLTFEFRIAGEAGSEQKVTFLPPYRMMITAPFPEIQTNNSKTNRVATS